MPNAGIVYKTDAAISRKKLRWRTPFRLPTAQKSFIRRVGERFGTSGSGKKIHDLPGL